MNATHAPTSAYFTDVPPGVVAVYVVSGLTTLVSVVMTTFLIFMHWRFYSQPTHQRYIIRILGLIPFYTLCSFFSILFINYTVYISLARDSYEAYVIYQFFRLCINFGGGQEELERKLAGSPAMPLPWPLCRKHMELDRHFLHRMKQGILQYVIVRPLTSILAVIFELAGVLGDGDYSGRTAYLYLVIINNISFTIALYDLVAFYWAIKIEIQPYRPLLKFITIKIAVFFSFWQGIFLAILAAVGAIPGFWLYDSVQAGIVINAALICVEMMFISVMHIWAYPYDMYRIMAMSQAPLIHDVQRSTSVLANVRHTLAQGDTIRDTVDAFGPRMLKDKFGTSERPQQQVGDMHNIPLDTDDENHDFGDGSNSKLGLADDSEHVKADSRR